MDSNNLKKDIIIEKGWAIAIGKIEEGYLYDHLTVNAKTRNEAKRKFIQNGHTEGMQLKYGDEVTYLTLPVVRHKDADLIQYNDKVIERYKLNCILELEKHNSNLKSILKDESITHCYIKKGGYYYRDNYCGYSEFKISAGVYPKEDAVRHATGITEIYIVPINIEEHNVFLKKHISEVESRLISLI